MAGVLDSIMAEGATPPPQSAPPGGNSSFLDSILAGGDGSSMGNATAAQAEALAKDRFEAMQKSYTDAVPAGAGFGTTMAASLPLDVQKRIAIFAKARGIPEDHYGVDNQGNIGFIDPVKGGWVREVPTLSGGQGWFSNPVDQFMRLGSQVADVTGPMSSQVAGGAAATVAPPPVKIPAAAGAAGIVDLGRQALGNYFAGSSPLDGLSYSNAAGQAALAGTGEGLGELAVFGLNKAFGRNSLRAAGADVARLRDPIALQQYQMLQMEAQKRGITLTPGNVTQVRSLLAAERQIYRQPEGQNALDAMYARRNSSEVPAAFREEIGRISKQASPALGARSMQQGAVDTLQAMKDQRSALSSPGYEAAKASGVPVDVSPTLQIITAQKGQVAAGSQSSAALSRAQSMLTRQIQTTKEVRVPTQTPTGKTIWKFETRPVTQIVPETDIGKLHSAKLNIDKMIDRVSTGELSVDGETLRALQAAKKDLTERLVDTSPEYRAGYKAHIDASPPVDMAREGLVGLAARDRTFYQDVPGLIGAGDPFSISQARALYERAGKLNAWNDGVRAYMETALREALKPTQVGGRPSNVAGKLYQGLWGDPTMRPNIEAALGVHGPLGNQRAQSFGALMEVLQKAATSLPEGSPTASDLGSRAAFAGRPTKLAAGAVKGTLSPWNAPEMLSNAMLEWSSGKNVGKLADLYTNNAAMAELQALRMLKPGSAAAVNLVANVLQKYGYLEAENFLGREPPRTPPILLPQPGAATGR